MCCSVTHTPDVKEDGTQTVQYLISNIYIGYVLKKIEY